MWIPLRLSRRGFAKFSGSTIAALAIGASKRWVLADSPPSADKAAEKPDADAVLHRLLQGNERFAKGEPVHPGRKPEDFRPLAEGQHPIAVILGCADSRVAPEILFDQGIGDLFVVRIAGNYVSGAESSVKGSVEYGVAELGVPLVMIMGHSQCGAVKAAIKQLHDQDALPGAINDLVSNIKPAVIAVEGKPGNLLDNAIRANVQMGVERLKGLEPILAPRVKKGEVKVVGAVYDLFSGKVTLLS
jgi:carbonic anhydrase